MEGRPVVNLKDCLGCGICSEVCQEGSIEMIISKDRVRKDSVPGSLRMILSLIYIYASMIPLVTLYRLFAGSMRARAKEAEPNANDVFRKDMQ